METLFIIIVSTIIGYSIGRAKKIKRQAEFEREQNFLDEAFINRHVRNGRIAYEREMLFQMRKACLIEVVEINERCKKQNGRIYQNVDDAMTEFDERHVKEWYKTGMVPPTYANNINYYNDKNKHNLWISA